jgi:hypothetical protein
MMRVSGAACKQSCSAGVCFIFQIAAVLCAGVHAGLDCQVLLPLRHVCFKPCCAVFAACRSDGSYSGSAGSGGNGGGPPPPGADMDISAAELVNRLSFHVSHGWLYDGL